MRTARPLLAFLHLGYGLPTLVTIKKKQVLA